MLGYAVHHVSIDQLLLFQMVLSVTTTLQHCLKDMESQHPNAMFSQCCLNAIMEHKIGNTMSFAIDINLQKKSHTSQLHNQKHLLTNYAASGKIC